MINNIAGRLTNNEQQAINEFKDLLLARFSEKIRKIILFGSKARGTFDRTSDIDLLILLAKDEKRISEEIAVLTHLPIAKYMVSLSPITTDEGFFQEWSPLLEHIKRDGILLWKNKKVKKNM